ncbi:MAG: hypothetical protein IJ083_07715 [Clostridia bacterium]|nr:hypothetical protein [Clostridia bacterium]
MQNPADPNATYRKKAGQEFIGYIINLVEAVGPMGSVVLSWDFQTNVTSDCVMSYAFLKESQKIVDGIQKWRDQYHMTEDIGMEKCQQLLQEKMALVEKAIREAKKSGAVLPRYINGECTPGPIQEETTDTSRQMSIDELLLSFEMPDHKDTSGDQQDKKEEGTGDRRDSNTQEDHAEKPAQEGDQVIHENSESKTVHEVIPDNGTEAESKPAVLSWNATDKNGNKYTAWSVFGLPGPEGILKPEFALLPDDQRRMALLLAVREKNPIAIDSSLGDQVCVADGAYSSDSLIEAARGKGFRLLPTDLLGKNVNPIWGLYAYAEDKKSVLQCPMGHAPVSQTLYRNGSIRIKMEGSKCCDCPYRNDCKCTSLKRSDEAAVTVSPNAQGRIITEANLGTETYKAFGRFRNGVETIPGYLHNHLDIDHLPIGQRVKQACMDLKVVALDSIKFILFSFGKTKYATNPIYNRQ